ncbi:hypothetical protein ACROYT_G008378, partial [Oculina patagonica]
TVEPRFNEPLYNEALGITNDILQPGQSYSEMYGTGPRYNEPRYNEILVITNTIRKPKRKMYLDITNFSKHTTKSLQKMNVDQTNKDENTLILTGKQLQRHISIPMWILNIKVQMLFLTVVQIIKCWVVQRNSVKNNY